MCATTRRSTRENIELYRHENESLRESSKRISVLEVENAALTQKVEVSSTYCTVKMQYFKSKYA